MAERTSIHATLSGRISTSGGSVSKAKVNHSQLLHWIRYRAAQTSENGNTSFACLRGEYTVSVEFAGFRNNRKNVVLQVGQSAELDFNVDTGRSGRKVEVRRLLSWWKHAYGSEHGDYQEPPDREPAREGREFIILVLLSRR